MKFVSFYAASRRGGFFLPKVRQLYPLWIPSPSHSEAPASVEEPPSRRCTSGTVTSLQMDMQSSAPPSAPPLAPPLAAQSMLWLLGLGLAVVSTILSTIGLLIQKTSADLEKHKSPWRRWRFWLGFAINLGSELTLTPVAMSLTPLSLLAPMTGVGIATGTLISASGCIPGLKEPLGCSEIMSTVLVIGGVVLTSIFGPHGEDEPSLENVEAAFASPAFIGITCTIYAYVVGLILVRNVKALVRLRPANRTIRTCLMAAAASSLLATYSALCMKVISTAARIAGEGRGDFVRGSSSPYVATIGLATSAPTQLYLLNMMMGNGSAVLAMPVYLSLIIICLTLCGAWIFDEFAELSALSLAILCSGILIVVLGIVTLSLAQHNRALKELAVKGRGTAEEIEPSAALEAAPRASFLRLFRAGAAKRVEIAGQTLRNISGSISPWHRSETAATNDQRTSEHAEHQLINWSKVIRV